MKIKGHTVIELKDVKTGEIERYEDDNLVTNAIGKMMDFAATHNGLGTNRCWTNPYTNHINLMQSMVCFDQPIANPTADTLYPPGNVTPVAYGVNGLTTKYDDIPELGLYSSASSSSTSTSRSWVWTFDENHGNGTISSICLVNHYIGFLGFGANGNRINNNSSILNESNWIYGQKFVLGTVPYQSKKGHGGNGRQREYWGTMSSESSYISICIDSENDVKYMYRVAADGLYILKHSLQFEKYDPFRSSGTYQSYTEEVYPGTYTGSYFCHFYNTDEKMLYFWTHSSTTIGSGTTIKIYKFDMVNKTVTEFADFLCNPGYNVAHLVISGTYNKIFAFQEGNSDYNRNIKMYDRTSGNWTSISGKFYPYYGLFNSFILNDTLYINGGYYPTNSGDTGYNAGMRQIIVSLPTGSVRYPGRSIGVGDLQFSDESWNTKIYPPFSNDQVAFFITGDYGQRNLGYNSYWKTMELGTISNAAYNVIAPFTYLATINNLETPVVKTNEKTMTITYTITAADLT